MRSAVIGWILQTEGFFLQRSIQNPARLTDGEVLVWMFLLPVFHAGKAGSDGPGWHMTERTGARLTMVAGYPDKILPVDCELLRFLLTFVVLVKLLI